MAFNRYKSEGIGTVETTVLTASATTTLIGVCVANTSAQDITVSIKHGTTYIIKNALIPIGSAFVPIGGDQKVVLTTSDTIKVTSSVAASADVIVSVLE